MRIRLYLLQTTIIIIFIFCAITSFGQSQKQGFNDSIRNLNEIYIIEELKYNNSLHLEPISSSSFDLKYLESTRVSNIKDISISTPNLYIPDYGSKITSSIYVRGIGTRIDNAVVGFYVDDIPLLNKSNFDFDFWDIQKIDIIRGTQGTLYGQNTLGGIIKISTLSPFNYQGNRIELELGNGGLLRTKLSTYTKKSDKFAVAAGVYYNSLAGFFTNTYSNKKCDWSNDAGGRIKLNWRLKNNWSIDNTTLISYVKQGGYAYSAYNIETKEVSPIDYNDKCGYKRTNLINGTKIYHRGKSANFSSITTIQLTLDDMTIDQDFSPKSMFTLNQSQLESAFSQEFILKQANKDSKFDWILGSYSFARNLSISAPVAFKEDGIRDLILTNINNGIHNVFPNDNILFKEKEFIVNSDFIYPRMGYSLYCQGSYSINKIKIIGGLRLDYEHVSLDYKNDVALNYLFTLTMQDYRELVSQLKGFQSQQTLELMPKISFLYDLKDGNNIYASLSKGYKSGGFNTQMFSDILQSMMKENMMHDLGISLDNTISKYSISDIIKYKPEYIWNYEIGSHLFFFDKKLQADIALFYMDCRNQQLTIFPDGQTTGRMMTNAGLSRSLGFETSLKANLFDNISLMGSYGYVNSRFIDYNNGIQDYSNKYLPYSPSNTLSLTANYYIQMDNKYLNDINFGVKYIGLGSIYFDDANLISQDYYSLIDVYASFHKGIFDLRLWAKNITNTKYNTFYFMSVGNSFVQRGKPLQWGLTLIMKV